jgi:hypothetical protein
MGVGVTPLLRRKAKIGSSDDRKAPVQAKVGFSGTQIHSIPQRKTRRREPAAIKRQMTRESRCSFVRSVAIAAPTSGRCLSRHAWERVDKPNYLTGVILSPGTAMC